MTFEELLNTLNPQALSVKKGDRLFQQGDAIKYLFFITSGKVKLIRDTIDGKTVLLHTGQENESIAEASLFSPQYHCSAIADSTCEIMRVRKHDILSFLEENPDAMMNLLSIFARQVRDLRTINEIKNIRLAKERILSYIRCNIDQNKEMVLKLSLKDIAHKIGLSHETFYRELKKLEDEDILERKLNQLKLL